MDLKSYFPKIKKQQPMLHVLTACVPLLIAAVYFFGWRVFVMAVLCAAGAYMTEALFVRNWKEPVTSAAFVTAILLTFGMPPTLPMWMALLGIIFAIVFGKMVYGGFGRNIFNPAMTGRAFIYICFGNYMTAQWYEPYRGFPGGFTRWGYTAASAPDVITSATPGSLLKDAAYIETFGDFSAWDLFIGNSSGVIGGTSALLTILCGLYIVWRKAANYRIVIAGFAGWYLVHTIFWLTGAGNVADPLRTSFSGALMIGVFFYATDPVSASQTNLGRWIYGAFIGVMSTVIATFSAWPAGTMFAILLANMFAPIMDYVIRKAESRK